MRPRHVNVGRLQVICIPRKKVFFRVFDYCLYEWVVYTWPLEWRWFKQ